MEIIRNLNEYILKIESEITNAKNRGKHLWADFDVPMESRAMGENLKIYFLSKGFSVDLEWCTQCKNFIAREIIIQF